MMNKKWKEFKITLGDWCWDIDLKKNQSKEFRIYDDKGYKTVRITSEILEEKEIEKCKSYDNFEGIDDYIEHLKDQIDNLIDVINEMRDKE